MPGAHKKILYIDWFEGPFGLQVHAKRATGGNGRWFFYGLYPTTDECPTIASLKERFKTTLTKHGIELKFEPDPEWIDQS
jgi:hypothetical protein